MPAGHNALRGSGLSQKPAFEMYWHEWVVLIAGSTGSALRAVRPPNSQTPTAAPTHRSTNPPSHSSTPSFHLLKILQIYRPRRGASIELLNEKEPGRGSDQALSGRRRGAYCTRNVGPKAPPQASSAFRSIVCENIPNIAPHIAANIRMGLRLHSEHQLSRGLRSSVQNRSSTNLRLYKIAHCNLFAIGTLFALFNPTGAGPRCQMH